jgi:hypothetical protein
MISSVSFAAAQGDKNMQKNSIETKRAEMKKLDALVGWHYSSREVLRIKKA